LYVLVTLLFQLFILDAVVEANFLAAAPQTTTWSEWVQSDSPWVPRITWMFGKLIIFSYVLGISQNRTDPRSFLRSAQLRALLSTMANRWPLRDAGFAALCGCAGMRLLLARVWLCD